MVLCKVLLALTLVLWAKIEPQVLWGVESKTWKQPAAWCLSVCWQGFCAINLREDYVVSNAKSTTPGRSALAFTILSWWIRCLGGASSSFLLSICWYLKIFNLQSSSPLNFTVIYAVAHATLPLGYLTSKLTCPKWTLNFNIPQISPSPCVFYLSKCHKTRWHSWSPLSLRFQIQSAIKALRLYLYVILRFPHQGSAWWPSG